MTFKSRTQPYPSIPQAWGIFGILILAQIVAAPIQLFLGEGSGLGLFLMYTVALSIGLAFALWNKSQSRNNLNLALDDFDTLATEPLIEHKSIPPILYLLCILAIPCMVKISGPIANMLPVPDFFMEQLESIVGGDIGFFHFLTIVVAAALFEETIFRGVILDGFLRQYTPKKAILYSAFLFAAVHMNPLQFPHTMVLGIFLGWIYYRTQSIWPCIWIHLVNNGSVFFMAASAGGIDTTSVEQPSSLAMLLVVPLGVALLYGMIQLIENYLPEIPNWQPDNQEEE